MNSQIHFLAVILQNKEINKTVKKEKKKKKRIQMNDQLLSRYQQKRNELKSEQITKEQNEI